MEVPRSKNTRLTAEARLKLSRDDRRNVFFKDRAFAREAMFAERRMCFTFEPETATSGPDVAAQLGAELKGPRKHDIKCLKELKRVLAAGAEHARRFMGVDGAFRALTACFVHNTDAKLRLEAAVCLLHLTCWGHKLCARVAKECGAYLVIYINIKHPELQEACSYVLRNICLDCSDCCAIVARQGMVEAACDAAALALDTKADGFVGPDCLFLLSAYLKKTAGDKSRPLPPEWFIKKMAAYAKAFPAANHFHWFLLNLSSCSDWVVDKDTAALILAAFCAENVEEDGYLALLRVIGNLSITNPIVIISSVQENVGTSALCSALKKGLTQAEMAPEVLWALRNFGSALDASGASAMNVAESVALELMPLIDSPSLGIVT